MTRPSSPFENAHSSITARSFWALCADGHHTYPSPVNYRATASACLSSFTCPSFHLSCQRRQSLSMSRTGLSWACAFGLQSMATPWCDNRPRLSPLTSLPSFSSLSFASHPAKIPNRPLTVLHRLYHNHDLQHVFEYRTGYLEAAGSLSSARSCGRFRTDVWMILETLDLSADQTSWRSSYPIHTSLRSISASHTLSAAHGRSPSSRFSIPT